MSTEMSCKTCFSATERTMTTRGKNATLIIPMAIYYGF